MITDIQFGANKKILKLESVRFYVYCNLSGTAFINPEHLFVDHILERELPHILSHETLHKVIFKLEGKKASFMLDKWCDSRNWIFQDFSGFALMVWEDYGLGKAEFFKKLYDGEIILDS